MTRLHVRKSILSETSNEKENEKPTYMLEKIFVILLSEKDAHLKNGKKIRMAFNPIRE